MAIRLLLILLLCCAPLSAQSVRPVVGEDVEHVVQSGDNLYKVAHSYGLGLEHVTFANKIPMQLELDVGSTLSIPLRRVLPANPPRDGLVLNVPERGIYFFRRGEFVKFYPVAVGRTDFPTPRGPFKVISRVKNPTWLPPAWAGLGPIAMGPGPKNPLGDRWIGLSAKGVGIHGTQSPMSIGDAVSHGCLRMYPDQVRELFDKVWVGMPVRIEYETAKLGRDASGESYLAAFPDLYGISDPNALSSSLLRAAGLKPEADVRAMLTSGRALPISSKPVVVQRGDVPVDLTVPPQVRGGLLWISSDLVRAVGLNVSVAAGEAVVSDVKREVAYPLASGPSQQTAAYISDGRTFFHAGALFEDFGVVYEWDKSRRVLSIQD